MINLLKKYIPESIKGPILSLLQPGYDAEFEILKGKKKIIISLAGFYQNLGDLALTYAQKSFISNHFPDCEIVLLSSHDTYLRVKALRKVCTDDDIITIIGGGNMDDVYVSLENTRRFIIRNFPKNKIISFPQTIAFSNTKHGKRRLKKTIRTYSKHKNLILFAREEKSFDDMKKLFPKNRVLIAPDIVLSLTEIQSKEVRNGALFCFRNDLEKSISNEVISEIKKIISKYFSDIQCTDTVNISLEECSKDKYENTLKKFWEILKTKELIVTDRLHCMIFCVITKTPCIVFSSNNHKIKGIYSKWLKDVNFIKFVDNYSLEGFDNLIKDIIKIDKLRLKDFSGEFNSLRDSFN